MLKYLDGKGADFPFVYYAQQYNVLEEQTRHMAIASEVLWLWFIQKPIFV